MLHNIVSSNLFFYYLIFINIVTFIVFFIDKYKARRNKWRIPEANLFFLSLIGGSVGGTLSMIIFRHKTQKLKFKMGMPMILILQILFFIYVIR